MGLSSVVFDCLRGVESADICEGIAPMSVNVRGASELEDELGVSVQRSTGKSYP